MQRTKFGVVACGLLGLVGCLLSNEGISFWAMREFDASHVYIVMGGYGFAAATAGLGVWKGMQRWMSIVAIVGFMVVLLRTNTDLLELMKAGIGGKVMGIAAIAGLVFAILTTVKPEPAR